MHEFASFHQRLQDQGLAPATYGSDLNPPFILTNSYADNVPHYTLYTPEVEHHQTPTHPPKGKHKFNHIAHKVDDIKKKDCEHAKKPIVEIDFKWPNIKHDNNSDKVHATATNIVQGLNETLNKIDEQVEVKKAAIKQLVDKSIENIDKTAGNVYQQIENESSKLIDRINKKLKTIESQLERLKFGWVKSVTELKEDADDDNEDDASRSIDDNHSR